MAIATEQQPVTERTPEVIAALERLGGNVRALNAPITALEEKLKPVMRIGPAEGEGKENIKMPSAPVAPLANDMRKLSETLEQFYCRLDDLLQRIEL